MSIAENKDVIRRYFDFIERGEFDRTSDLVDEKAAWWIQGRGDMDKKTLHESHVRMGASTTQRKMVIVGMIGEGDRVAVEIEGDLKMTDGRSLANTFHIAFTLRDGKILAAREYFDTALVKAFRGQ